ncbi:valine--tRNA ligase [Candidatus Woesearchaeota archaeon]|nr:valine--tRNA ligase [Candidatus Woesearchaeota archaeon]
MAEPKIKEKRWDKALEEPIVKNWKTSKKYSYNINSKKQMFSIDTPPPYVNTPIHIGQTTTYIIMDMFARYNRMKGHEVLFPMGLDRNGLPIEMAAEKKFNVQLKDISREKATEYCKTLLQESSLASIDTFYRCGVCFNSWELGDNVGDVYYTDSPEYRRLTQDTFIDLYNKGVIYEDDRVNNYCPGCQTTLANAEVDYENVTSTFNDIIFKSKETNEDLIIGTTRPELIATCAMIIYNPKDKRYKHLEDKTAITPIFEKEIPIKAHPSTDINKGTGLVMMCSYGDLTDIRFFREMKLKPVIAIDQNGKMNEHAGLLKGLTVKEARKKIIELLKRQKLLVNQTQITHNTPVCERSRDEIEFISMKEFYLKQVNIKTDMKKLAKKLNFYDDSSRNIMLDWIESITIDWPISRNRYYATEVPVWHCKKCNEIIIPPKGKYYQPWKDKSPITKCPKCSSTEIEGDKRVFDTWFDSSNSPLYILRYGFDDTFFKNHKPCTVRPQGKEIIRTWLYYTVLKAYLLTGELIFNDAWINYHIVDDKGHKMSKSKGNVIDPKEVLDKSGAEPLRLWASIEGNLERQDFRCNFERIEGAGKTLTKLYNVARFISMFEQPKGEVELLELDNWIINEINNLITFCDERYAKYDNHNPGVKLKHFLWETFASHYLELAKRRAYNQENKFSKKQQNGAIYALHYCMQNLLKLFAPIIPIITYKLYNDLYNADVHFENFPIVTKEIKAKITTDDIIAVNSFIWKHKKDKELSLKDQITNLTLPQKYEIIKTDLEAMHNLENTTYQANKFKAS